MNRILTISITSIMAITLLTLVVANSVAASEDDSDDGFGTEDECAKKFNPEYDRSDYLTCMGGIGVPNPGP